MEEGSNSVEMAGAVIAFKLKEASSWWQDINESPFWQDRIFHVLAALYSIVAAVALIQLIRIQLRVPEYGWTTQKVFHFLNFLVNGVRCLVFVFRRNIESIHPSIFQHILLDSPSLAFFTTYALLVLFWAEIYYQARAVSTDGLRPSFFTINAVVYAIQALLNVAAIPWYVSCAASSLNWWCWLLPKLCCESFTKLNDFRSDESGLFKRSLISTKFDW